MRLFSASVLVIAICSVTIAMASEPLVNEQVAIAIESTEELKRLAAKAQQLSIPEGVPAARWQIDCKNLLMWSDRFGNRHMGDLSLVVYPTVTGVVGDFATAGQWNGNRHPMDVSGLTRDGTKLSGVVRVQLFKQPVPQWVDLTLDATVTSERVQGSYQAPGGGAVRPGAGALDGKVTKLHVQAKAPGTPEEDLMASEADNAALRLRWADQSAAHWYRLIRAHVLARDAGVSPTVAWHLSGSQPLVWPGLEKIKKAKAVIKKKGGDALIDAMLDDDLLGDDDEAPPGRKKKKKSKSAPAKDAGSKQFKSLAVAAADVAQRNRSRKAAAEAALRGQAEDVPRGDAALGDSAFGPWYGGPLLDKHKQAANDLPAHQAGDQAWATVGAWTCAGPFPQRDRSLIHPLLPDSFPSFALKTALDKRRIRGPGKSRDPGPHTCIGQALIESGSGRTQMPPFMVWEDHGHQRWDGPNSTWYAQTTVFSAKAAERWAAITCSDHVSIWMDDRLVWATPPIRNLREREATYRARLPFKQGVNRLTLRLDNDIDTVWFRLRLCTAGGPREAASVKAAEERIAQAQAAAGSPVAGTQGFRNDGSGRYEAQPPLAWNPFDGTNVRWSVPLGFSFATPVFIDDLVITMEEPHTVVAIEQQTGKERWRTECDIVSLRSKELQAEAEQVRTAAAKARQELADLGPGRLERITKLMEGGMTKADAESKVKTLDRTAGGYLKFLSKAGVKEPGWYRDIGHTYSTPVTDGRHIWVKINTGALACLDKGGNIVWLVDHEHSVSKQCSSVSSPVLIGDRLLMLFPEQKGADWKDESINVVLCYDAKTGKRLWRCETAKTGQFTGGLVAMRLANGSVQKDVVITANGAIVDVATGKLLYDYLGIHELYGTPITDGGNQVIFGAPKNKAVFRLHLLDEQRIGVETVWSLDSFGYFQDGNYGLHHEGQLYYSRPGVDVCQISDGKVTGTIGSPFFCPRNGRGYPPNVLAGGHLYVADNATWFAPTNRPHTSRFPGALSAILPGRPGVVLARNQIGKINGGFAPHGDALYVRARGHLSCYAHTGEAGKRYEAEQVAREILGQYFPDKPSAGDPVHIDATMEIDRKGLRFDPGKDSKGWQLVGPFGADQVDGVAAELAQATWMNGTGGDSCQGAPAKRLHGGNMGEWRRSEMFDLSKFNGGHLKHIGWDSLVNAEIDLPKLAEPQAGKMMAFATTVRCHYPRTVRVDGGHPAARVWLGGQAVAQNTAVTLSEGHTSFVVIIAVDQLDGAHRLARPRLWPSQGAKDQERWLQAMDPLKPYLEQAAKLAPDTPAGAHAKRILGQL